MTENRYCSRLGVEPPDLFAVIRTNKKIRPFQLMVLALLEHGGPMTLDQIANRLVEAGYDPLFRDPRVILQKAWHGMPPVHKESDGSFGLDLFSDDLDLMLFVLGLRDPRPVPFVPQQVEVEAPPVLLPKPTKIPRVEAPQLTAEELGDAAYRFDYTEISRIRQVAAFLDAVKAPATVEEINTFIAEKNKRYHPITEREAKGWHGPLVRYHEGLLLLDRTVPEVHLMRAKVRTLAEKVRAARQRDKEQKYHFAQWEMRRAEKERAQRREAASLRRLLIHGLPEGAPEAFVTIDLQTREMNYFWVNDQGKVAERLGEYNLVVGLHVRDLLHSLKFDPDRWQLIDLRPPHKTRRLNKSGRTLKITPAMLITSSTGISRPLADPKKIRGYLAKGEHGKFQRRLESDAKALYAFYRYGAQHRTVRLRWGFLDEIYPVSWAHPGDESFYSLLDRASKTGEKVEIVFGSAPGWEEPWKWARRGIVEQLQYWSVHVRLEDGSVWLIRRDEIQAVRIIKEITRH